MNSQRRRSDYLADGGVILSEVYSSVESFCMHPSRGAQFLRRNRARQSRQDSPCTPGYVHTFLRII